MTKFLRVCQRLCSRHLLAMAAVAMSMLCAVGNVHALSTSADDTSYPAMPRFATSRMIRNGALLDTPILRLKSDGSTDDLLVFSFDELRDDQSDLQASLVHCNADWSVSALTESEYSDGINVYDVEDYAYSSNTFVRYINYQIPIPNEDLMPKVSGNYIIRVYDRTNPDETLVEGRFQVSEDIADISAVASGRTDYGINTQWQQLSLQVSAPEDMNINPVADMFVTIEQNMRPETLRRLNTPMSVQHNTLTFEHLPQLTFDAGNEYRRFETVRTDYEGMHIDSIRLIDRQWHMWLQRDESREELSHVFDATQHGRFAVDEYSATNPDLGADYVMVHFTLDVPLYDGADVYVEGDLTGRVLNESNRMTYDPSQGVYTLTLPLKQGSYNYQYVVAPRNADGRRRISGVDGNKYETSNEYNICVYLRTPGARADRLIGSSTVYSE